MQQVQKRNIVVGSLSAVTLGMLLWFYYSVDPTADFMPRCVVKTLTGFSCPGCGSQRFLHTLMQGHPLQAVGYNYFIPIGFILIGISLWLEATRKKHPQRYRYFMRPLFLYLVFAVIIVWTILRNILAI